MKRKVFKNQAKIKVYLPNLQSTESQHNSLYTYSINIIKKGLNDTTYQNL